MSQPKQLGAPDLSATLDAAKRDVKTSFNAVNIGIIKEFNATNQTATVQIAIKQVVNIDPLGVKSYQEHPLILQCPVMTLFGGASFINLPIAAGDNCIVLFNDREIDNWLYNGGVQAPTTPRVHDISDAIAIVGIRSLNNSITAFLPNGIRIQFDATDKIDVINNAINSLSQLWTHTGNMRIDGNITVNGDWYGDSGGAVRLKTDLIQDTGKVISAGNGATGTFNTVTVVNGIVVSGTRQ